jgi:hypothetical protein
LEASVSHLETACADTPILLASCYCVKLLFFLNCEIVDLITKFIKSLVEKEKDLEILKKWHKMAAKVESIDDFRNKVGLIN